MKSQIFKDNVPNKLLFDFLENTSIKHNNYYLFDKCAYKKALLKDTVYDFLSECRKYYHTSKYKYLDKPLTFNSLVTVIRQICKCNNITYTSKIKYDHSTYDLLYYIYTI